jgi:hypothetical protein
LPEQTFQRGLVRVNHEVAGKLTANATGGVEFRKTEAGDQTTPVFTVGSEYRPTERLTVSADLFRQVNASGASPGENYTRTGGALRFSQRLGSRFAAGLEAGYEMLDYTSTRPGVVATNRSDDYVFLRPSLKYEFNDNRRAEVYYSLRDDDSSLDAFDFTSNQLGLAIGFDF